LFSLEGKKAVITGATGGIGQAIAKTFHQAGATIVISGTRESALNELAQELGNERVHSLTCNLSDAEQVESLIDKSEELLGDIDILVCNAGITKDNLAIRMKNEDFESVIKINLTSSFILNRAALKRMMKKKWGRIINISSVVAVAGNPGQSNYVASKAGLIGMSKSLALEVASRNVTINTIAPGFIETPMTDVLKDEQKDKLKTTIPMGYFGKPEDIAYSALFLAAEEARYITGQTLHVNGGMIMI
jgi:3-oxoacyl-[acyl-carrier protein] reductase